MDMMSFWWLILFFIDLFFICSLRSFICKKYANANGKDSNYTNAIDISITEGGVGGAVGWGGGSVGGTGSFIACIASISAAFFYIIENTFFQLIHKVFPAFASCLNTFWVFCNFL